MPLCDALRYRSHQSESSAKWCQRLSWTVVGQVHKATSNRRHPFHVWQYCGIAWPLPNKEYRIRLHFGPFNGPWQDIPGSSHLHDILHFRTIKTFSLAFLLTTQRLFALLKCFCVAHLVNGFCALYQSIQYRIGWLSSTHGCQNMPTSTKDRLASTFSMIIQKRLHNVPPLFVCQLHWIHLEFIYFILYVILTTSKLAW